MLIGVFDFWYTTLHIVLEDIFYITGLPIDGNPMIADEDEDPRDICEHLLGICSREKDSTVKFRWLENFKTLSYDVRKQVVRLDFHVRSHLLFLLGSTIFSSTSRSSVHVMYLKVVEDIDELNNYAWGVALLTHLHISLDRAKRGRKKYRRSHLGS